MFASRPGRMRPDLETRTFISFDGTPIGYQVTGAPDGIPMLLANGVGATITAYRFVIHHFRDRFRFYAWDYRGMYSSGRPLGGYDAMTVEHHARDGLALVQHEGLEGALAFGWSMGVQVLLEMCRAAECRLRGLVLHNGVAGRPYRSVAGTDLFGAWVPRTLRTLQRADGWVSQTVRRAAHAPWLIPLASRVGLVHHALDREVFVDIAQNFKQLDMHLYLEALQRLGEHDASDVLEGLAPPTLLLASTHDRMIPLSAMERMRERIPDCELRVIPGGTHYAAVEFPELINRHVESWLERRFSELSRSRPARVAEGV